MKRVLSMVTVLAALVATTAWGGTNSQGGVSQAVVVGWWDNATSSGGNVTVTSAVEESSADAAVTPSVTFMASGITFSQAGSTSYPTQNVAPTALNMDPLGNSATVSFTFVTPVTTQVTLRLTRPQSLQLVQANPQPNAWHDNGTVFGSVGNAGVFINRYGYTVTGTVGSTNMANAFTYPQTYNAFYLSNVSAGN